jgi:hypothetical protein
MLADQNADKEDREKTPPTRRLLQKRRIPLPCRPTMYSRRRLLRPAGSEERGEVAAAPAEERKPGFAPSLQRAVQLRKTRNTRKGRLW